MVKSNSFDDLEKLINYTFKDKRLLAESLTHKSYKGGTDNNERLEFLGDAVLDLMVGELLFHRFKNKGEGVLSKLRSSLVREDSLFRLAKSIGLGSFIILSATEEKSGGRDKVGILSDAFEALVGALYLDAGIELAKEVFYALLINEFGDIKERDLIRDYKSRLQEFTQDRFSCIPMYSTVMEDGPDHNKSFTVQVKINGSEYAVSKGNTKKVAQQNAAKLALRKLRGAGIG